ncbi:ABC-2 type transport system permease protein [Lacibacter cauensis]|uniref:Transport permease protein n=1 Tax=Lacibacter cauensis TaxID=510947 RepID=A0A562SR31_9BACT|nr:ABC transporter permease [Lacibacter cauensis]TWI83672.1 ABC-2 type transport system permease protein [Lacibacter cauensis]
MSSTVLRDWNNRSNKIERIWLLAKIEFKLRYYENKLGLLWALLKPISEIFIFYVAFEIVLKQGVPNFVSFLFIALIMWNFFVESTAGTIQILNAKKYLYEYTNMNKLEIYLSTILSNCIGFFFNLSLFLIYFQFLDNGTAELSLKSLYIIPIFINLVVFSLAFSLILSNIYVLAKDITQIWLVITGVGFWLSPILFKLELFRKALPGVDYLNPISGIIINARNVILYNKNPEWDLMAFGWVYSSFLLFLGLILLNKIGSKAAEKL